MTNRFLIKQQILNDQAERKQRFTKLVKGGEREHKKEVVPTKEDCRKDVEELIGLVHGAVKARIQLGFDHVGETEYSLKPLIKDLKDRVGNHTKPLIRGEL